MDWDEYYQKGEVFWDKGAPAPALRQYLECHAVRGRALVPGCGRGHEEAVAVEHGSDATGLEIAPTGVWGRPSEASAEKGAQALDAVVMATTKYIETTFRQLAEIKAR